MGVYWGKTGANGGTIGAVEVVAEGCLMKNSKGSVIWGFQAEGLATFEFFVFFPIFGL